MTSTFITGSCSTGAPLCMPSLKAIEPAILNAISFESTSCEEPSYRLTFTSTPGYPPATPLPAAPRPPDVPRHTEPAQHAVHQHFEVEFAHPRDNRLARGLVRPHVEGGVFLRQLAECFAHLLLVGGGFGLHRHVNHRVGKRDRLEDDRVRRVGQRLAREGVLQRKHRRD